MSNIVQFKRLSRMDGYKNLMTGYGTGRDHIEQFTYSQESQIQTATLEAMYAQHPLAWKIVDLFPDDGLREWIDIDHDESTEIEALLEDIGLREALEESLKMARLLGGSAIFLDIDDGKEPFEPLDLKGAQGIRGCEVLEKDYLNPELPPGRSLRIPLWRISGTERVIHESRLLRFHGVVVSREWMLNNNGWGQSCLQRSSKPLIASSLAHGFVPNVLKDFIRDVIKINDLAGLADDPDQEAAAKSFWDRLDYMFLAESLLNKAVLDKEDEFIRQTTSVAGLPGLIRDSDNWLAMSTSIPKTKFFGESPGGNLSQVGTSQEKDWFKTVAAYQEATIRPALRRVFKVIQATLKEPECIHFKFRPLDVPTQKEQAEVLEKAANALAKLVDAGIISAAEAASCFDGSELKMMPVLDFEARAQMAEMKELEIEDDEDTPPL